jgi:hypothetical protein
MFRADTARTNVAYRVIRVGKAIKKKEVEEMVLGVVRQKTRKYRTGKIVVYGNSVPKVKELAKKLGCHAYHHHAIGKAGMLEDFIGGKQRIIVATSALGMGVDIADIRCIVHMDWPFSILDYAQESGRAGRDGLRSEAVVIAHEGDQRRAEDQQTATEQAMVRLYAEGEHGAAGCRRVVLDGYLDRRRTERVGCEEGEEKCDVCRGDGGESEAEGETSTAEGEVEDAEEEGEVGEEGEVEEGEEARENRRRVFEQQERERRGPRETFMQDRQQEFGEVEWLQRQLAWWAKRCGLCEAAGDRKNSGHDVRQCWRAESREVKAKIEEVDAGIKYERYAACWGCGAPQAICNAWEEDSRGRYQAVKGGICQYKGVLTGGLIGIVIGYGEIGERWIERLKGFGVDGAGPGRTIIEYLGRKQGLERVESSCLVREFCWITRLLVEERR